MKNRAVLKTEHQPDQNQIKSENSWIGGLTATQWPDSLRRNRLPECMIESLYIEKKT